MTVDQALMLREMKSGRKEEPRPTTVALPQRPVRVIAVTSGKGGVGKTNIAVNLAYYLSSMKQRVLILDADTGLANVDLILGLTPRYNLYHVLKGEKSIAETIIHGPGGIMVLPASSGILEMAELSRGQKLTLLDELRYLSEGLDFLLIDTAAGIAGNVMFFNAAAKEIIIVVSSEPTSLTDAYALIKVLYQRHAKKRFRLLVNMARSTAEAKEVYKRLSQATDHFLNLTIEYLGDVLYDEKLPNAVKQQKAIGALYPQASASRCLKAIAEKICQEKPENDGAGSIEFFWEDIADIKNG
ncbi:MAG: MinD/ParA family protein [Syntrophales bacterium]